jgi:Uma2 family endonuclease
MLGKRELQLESSMIGSNGDALAQRLSLEDGKISRFSPEAFHCRLAMNLSPPCDSFADMNRPNEQFQRGAGPAHFTAAEFLRMAELGSFDEMKVELDHGELVRLNPPNLPHGVGQARVSGALFHALRSSDLEVAGEVTIILGDDTVRAFDAAVISRAALSDKVLRPEHVLLAVEVADTTLEQDLGRKLRDYAAAGIPVYWVVDVNARVIHVLTQPTGDDYKRAVVRFGEPLAVPGTNETIVID